MADAPLRAVAVALGIAYAVLLASAVASTTRRWARYRGLSIPVPRLLRRDLILLVGHAVPLLGIGAARAITHGVALPFAVLIAAMIPPLFAMGVYLYYEIFVIGG